MPHLPLAQLQQLFKSALQNAPSAHDAKLGIRETAAVSTETRLEIYRYAYWARLTDSLKEDFPRVLRLLTHEGFENAAKAYFRQYPSRSASLAELGEHFVEYVKEHPAADMPFLEDVAKLDWARAEVNYLLDERRLDPQALAQIPPADLPRVHFSLNTSVRLVSSPWRLLALGRTRRALASAEGPTYLLLFREKGKVVTQRLTAVRFRLLQALADGTTLGELEPLLKDTRAKEAEVFGWFLEWVKQGIFASFTLQGAA